MQAPLKVGVLARGVFLILLVSYYEFGVMRASARGRRAAQHEVDGTGTNRASAL